MSWTKPFILACSFIPGLLGLSAFFLPDEVAGLFGDADPVPLLIQLYGAALIGFGYANWLVRNSPLGGIYGRAIVGGNLIHFGSGSGLLTGVLMSGSTDWPYILLCFIYIVLATGSGVMLFGKNLKGTYKPD